MKYVLDNSNLAESYSGVTTPLTHSFASHVYREVYQYFCKKMGVSQVVIRQHKEAFSNLLAFVGYRMYYNMGNWYLLVSFLPAYKFNRRFFDRMLGVETSNSDDGPPLKGSFRKYGLELPRVTIQLIRIGYSFLTMGRLVKRFNREFDKTFAELESVDSTSLSPSALAKHYFSVLQKLLRRWWVPIANDFAVMVSTGIANKVLTRWLGQINAASRLYVEARGSLVSLDPGQHLICIVNAINKDASVYMLFRQGLEPAQLLQLLSERYPNSETYQLIQEYLGKYGDRMPNELKLEAESLRERPELLLGLLRALVGNAEVREPKHERDLPQNRRLYLNPVKRALLKWLLSWTGKSISRREETRFRRALIFGWVRRLFLALGSQFHKISALDDPRDIFYLTEEEVFRLVKSPRNSAYAKTLVACRKAELQEWKQLELPRHIEADEPFQELLEKLSQVSRKRACPVVEDRLKGTVAARGSRDIIRGTALVLPEFSTSAAYTGKVLVTRHTDPGWTIIFPFISGLIVERGGILSHAAIVARELGIPCLVGVEGATSIIPDGATIEMHLATGEIRVPANGRKPEGDLCLS